MKNSKSRKHIPRSRKHSNKAPKEGESEQLVLVNEFGVPLYIDKSNPSQMRDRVKLIQKVVETGKPIGYKNKLSQKEIKRAKMHLRWYKKELETLVNSKEKRRA